MRIYIPTYKRSDRQITYNNLPKEIQQKVTFIINECEKDISFFQDKQTIVLPDSCKIAEKREMAFLNSKNEKFAVFDDDIIFHKRIEGKTKKLESFSDFQEMFDFFSNLLDDPEIFLVNPIGTHIFPNFSKDYQEAVLSSQSNFFDGPKLLKENLDWTSLQLFEDAYLIMQMLSKGYVNRVYNNYCFVGSKLNSKGGCSTFRTSQVHNESLLKLKKAFPEHVSIIKTKEPYMEGIQPGTILKSRLQPYRLWKDSVKKNKTKSLMI